MALINKLTAIANAIRAKTGGTAALSLDDMVTEIGNIGGGGLYYYEERTFTSDASSIKITHNLGTQKLLCAITPLGSFTAGADGGYQTQTGFWANFSALTSKSGFEVDYSAYHPNYSGGTTYNYNGHSGLISRSPWTSQNTPYAAVNVYSGLTVDSDNEITIGDVKIPSGNTYAIFVMGMPQ